MKIAMVQCLGSGLDMSLLDSRFNFLGEIMKEEVA